MGGELETPLFLSRLMLNPFSRQVMSEIAHPYEMHRTIMRAFPEQGQGSITRAREEFGVLFRCESKTDNGTIMVYVQSLLEPDWSFLEGLRDYLHRSNSGKAYEWKDIMPAYRKLKNGQLLSFRLKANPTKRVAKEGDPLRGKRVDLLREADQIDWLVRKSNGNGGIAGGFEILSTPAEGNGPLSDLSRFVVRVRSEGKLKSRKGDSGYAEGGSQVTHLSVIYEGILRVTDREAFIQTLVHGIGSGKAFGFGLLSIAPVGVFDRSK